MLRMMYDFFRCTAPDNRGLELRRKVAHITSERRDPDRMFLPGLSEMLYKSSSTWYESQDGDGEYEVCRSFGAKSSLLLSGTVFPMSHYSGFRAGDCTEVAANKTSCRERVQNMIMLVGRAKG